MISKNGKALNRNLKTGRIVSLYFRILELNLVSVKCNTSTVLISQFGMGVLL